MSASKTRSKRIASQVAALMSANPDRHAPDPGIRRGGGLPRRVGLRHVHRQSTGIQLQVIEHVPA